MGKAHTIRRAIRFNLDQWLAARYATRETWSCVHRYQKRSDQTRWRPERWWGCRSYAALIRDELRKAGVPKDKLK